MTQQIQFIQTMDDGTNQCGICEKTWNKDHQCAKHDLNRRLLHLKKEIYPLEAKIAVIEKVVKDQYA